MKKIFTFLILLLSSVAYCQNTTVTATVQYPDGNVFAFGTVQAVFTPISGNIQKELYKINGNTFPYYVSGVMDGTGTFSISLTDDHLVRPLGGRWMFTVCSIASSPCSNSLQDVFGTTINLTTLINASVQNPAIYGSNVPSLYADSEVIPNPTGGSSYFNLVTKTFRCYNGSTWAACGGAGGGGSPGLPLNSIQYNCSSSFCGSGTLTNTAGTITFPTTIGGTVGGATAITTLLPESVADTWNWTFTDGGVQTGTGHHDWTSQIGYNVFNNAPHKATESTVYWGFESNWEQAPGDSTSSQDEFYLYTSTPNAAGGGPVGGPINQRVIFGTQNKLTGFIKFFLNADSMIFTSGSTSLALPSVGLPLFSSGLAINGILEVGATDTTFQRIAPTAMALSTAPDGTSHDGTFYLGNIGIKTGSSLTLNNPFQVGPSTNGTDFDITASGSPTLNNSTVATIVTPQGSPAMFWSGQYWNGAASATETFELTQSIDAGTNGTERWLLSAPTSVGTPSMDLSGVVLSIASGSTSAPGIGFLAERNMGFDRGGSHITNLVVNGIIGYQFDYNWGLYLLDGNCVGFSGTTTSLAKDASFCHPGPNGVINIGQAASATDSSGMAAGNHGVAIKSTNALTAGQPVKVDTGNASQVLVTTTTDTGAGAALGIVYNSPGAGATAYIITTGLINTPLLGTGTCAIGQFVIVDTTTNGRVKCTSVYTAGTILGIAIAAQAVVGNAVTMIVGLN